MRHDVRSALLEGYTEPIRDMLWGHIYLTPALAALTESPPFMRLHRILQLGPAFRVYPGATHTRASHSIGVYHLARRLLSHLAELGADAWLSPEGVKSFLCAALLHDLGHFPYTHSLKELPLEEHEALTGRLILSDPVKGLVAAAGGNPDLTAAIVDTGAKGEGSELFFYRRLLSGALDPDKLDYLSRDGRCCGVPYGAQDVDFILSRLYPSKERGVDIDSRMIPNVEAILFSKYLMYRTVYWHKQVRAATAMIKKSLINSFDSGKLSGENLYNLDDMGLFTLLAQNSMVESVREGRIYTMAAEFSQDKIDLTALREVGGRVKYEEKLAQELRRNGLEISGKDIIIDIPEPVSFETGLYVLDEACCFEDSSSAFKPEMVNSLIQSLYTIRVFFNQKYRENMKTFVDACSILFKKEVMEA